MKNMDITENIIDTKVETVIIPDYNIKIRPDWISGLIDGEGSFGIGISKNVNSLGNCKVGTTFYLGLKGPQRYVLEAIKNYLGCGIITTAGKNSGFFFSYQIKKNADLQSKLFPLLDKYTLCTTKRLDYLDFKKVVQMVGKKEHLTPRGLEIIRNYKIGMNTGRIILGKIPNLH